MSSLTFVQQDTDPSIQATLVDDVTQAPLDLTTATGVRFQMRRPHDRKWTVNAGATIVSAPAGTVSYSWGPNDLNDADTFQCQWEVTWAGGRVQTQAIATLITVRRK
jgi:hypothetical protein